MSSEKKPSESETPAPKSKREVLSLIDDVPKKPRRRRNKDKDSEPQEPEGPSELEKQKESALSLWKDEEKKQKAKEKKGKRTGAVIKGSSEDILPPISQLKAEERPRRKAVEEPKKEEEPVAAEGESEAGEGASGEKTINLKPPIIVKDLADALGLKPFKVIQDLIAFEVFATPDKSVEPDIAEKICEKHGFVFEKERREKGAGVHKVEEVVEEPAPPEEEKEDELVLRPPIITFMGHVDHGKTTLMDALRKSRVAAGEDGGITQHIAAYSIPYGDSSITLLDTPGHAAFTKMRARGANVTDIVVLVVAADDGVMPQTVEALNHARAAGATIVVALNKMDAKGANPDRVKQQLQKHDLAPVEWGGSTECVEVSALEGTGLDNLLETMHLQAEVLELKANPKGPARATVIESKIEAGKGPTATAIVQSGNLEVGQAFICGPFAGKVKSLIDDNGDPVKSAGPAKPVEILGFSGTPNVGDEIVVMDNERSAKKLSGERQDEIRKEKLKAPKRANLESFFGSMGEGKKTLKVVLKCDVQGSVEAILGALDEIKSEKISLDIIHSAAGAISESDILLASASDGIVIGFNTKVESKAVQVARREGIQVKLFSVIYELLAQVEEAMLGMLDPETREKIIGHASVKAIFKVSRGRVAGCMVTDGRIDRKARARVLRRKQPVYDGAVQTLRRYTDDVAEVKKGLECGIRLGNFNEYEEDDVIECYELEKLEVAL